MNPREAVHRRVNQLPRRVFKCDRCGESDGMQLRRSSLNETFMADDIGLKCERCFYYATHGIPFESPEQFRKEQKARDGRVIDFTRDEEGQPDKENLAALGYIAKSKEVD